MPTFNPPPTYAEVVLVDKVTKAGRFNPIWLKWFLDLAQVLSSVGASGGGIDHNSTTGKQGGAGTEFYHLTAAEAAKVASLPSTFVSSFNTRTGAVTLTSGDVTGALGFTPISASSVDTLTNKTINLTSNTLIATSAQLAAALTDETGTGFVVFSASPTFTGIPIAPTAAAGVSTTQLATTAFINPASTTWTPTLTFATPGNLSVVYSTQSGSAVRTGNLIYLTWLIVTSTFTHTTASGACRITGLPYTSENLTNANAFGAMLWEGITKASYTDISARLLANSNIIDLVASGSAQAVANVNAADMPTGGTVILSGSLVFKV